MDFLTNFFDLFFYVFSLIFEPSFSNPFFVVLGLFMVSLILIRFFQKVVL